jgi:hypothetical protein
VEPRVRGRCFLHRGDRAPVGVGLACHGHGSRSPDNDATPPTSKTASASLLPTAASKLVPLLDFYDMRGILVAILANQPVETVSDDILTELANECD